MNTREKGDIGVAQAIFWYTKNGFHVSKPLTDAAKYDLIVDKKGTLYRVEVKTTFKVTQYNIPLASLRTNGGNRSWNKKSKKISLEEADLLFISVAGREAYEIPLKLVNGMSSVNLSEKYKKYKLEV